MLLNGGLMFIVATLLFTDEISGKKIKKSEINYRLPDDVIPLHYSIDLLLLRYNDTEEIFHYTGGCNITLFVLHSTHNITFHLDNSTVIIEKAEIDDYFVVTQLPVTSYNVTKNTMTLYFTDKLSPGIYVLNVEFHGIAHDNEYIFFRTLYKNGTNYTELTTVTNFQRIGARRVFPCWDEPAMKATFQISVTDPKYTIWSNMPIAEILTFKGERSWTSHVFHITPPISPNRIGILSIENGLTDIDKEGNAVHYRQAIQKDVKFAKIMIQKVTKHLQLKWKIREIQKIDHVIIPGLIDNGIQNWRLICHNEADIVYNHVLDSAGRDREVARLLARQVASQWFSNLVSPTWWSDEWLNEGLTMFLGMDAINKLFPDYQMMDLFVVQNRDLLNFELYMEKKSFTSQINSPSDINSLSLFPYYLKASAFLRTLQHVITEKVFQKGVRNYLNAHKFSSATSNDFWTAMQTALKKSHVHKSDLRENLLHYMWYYACITVKVNRDYDTGYTNVSIQYNIFNDNCEYCPENIKMPVTYTTQNNINFNMTSPKKSMWMNTCEHRYRSLPLSFHSNDTDGWLILNLQQTSYYRVNYDVINWQRIVEYLNTKEYTKIHVLNRAQLINDIFNIMLISHECHFMKCDEVYAYSATLFLRFLRYLSQETNFVAWYPMFKAFEYLSRAFPLSNMTNVKKQMRNTLNNVIKITGYDDPTENFSNKHFYHSNIILRHEILRWACVLSSAKCKYAAQKKLLHFVKANLSNPDTIWPVPGLKEWTLCNGIMKARYDIWHKMLNMWLNTSDNKLLEFLACTENYNITKKYLDLLASKVYFVKATDRIRSFYFIVAKRINNNTVFNYIVKNYDTIIPREVGITRALIFIINHLYDKEELAELYMFVWNLKHLISLELVRDKIINRMIHLKRLEDRIERTGLLQRKINKIGQ